MMSRWQLELGHKKRSAAITSGWVEEINLQDTSKVGWQALGDWYVVKRRWLVGVEERAPLPLPLEPGAGEASLCRNLVLFLWAAWACVVLGQLLGMKLGSSSMNGRPAEASSMVSVGLKGGILLEEQGSWLRHQPLLLRAPSYAFATQDLQKAQKTQMLEKADPYRHLALEILCRLNSAKNKKTKNKNTFSRNLMSKPLRKQECPLRSFQQAKEKYL